MTLTFHVHLYFQCTYTDINKLAHMLNLKEINPGNEFRHSEEHIVQTSQATGSRILASFEHARG